MISPLRSAYTYCISSRECFKSGDDDPYRFDLQGVIAIYIHV
jgi:hypothetical protein